jgi:hypothetical protein
VFICAISRSKKSLKACRTPSGAFRLFTQFELDRDASILSRGWAEPDPLLLARALHSVEKLTVKVAAVGRKLIAPS